MSEWESMFGSASAESVIDGINAGWLAERREEREYAAARQKAAEALLLTAFRGDPAVKEDFLQRIDNSRENGLFSGSHALLSLLPGDTVSYADLASHFGLPEPFLYLIETILQNLRGNDRFYKGDVLENYLVKEKNYAEHINNFENSSFFNYYYKRSNKEQQREYIMEAIASDRERFEEQLLNIKKTNSAAFDWLRKCILAITPGTYLTTVIPEFMTKISEMAYHWIKPEPCAVPALSVIQARQRGVLAPADMIDIARQKVETLVDDEGRVCRGLEASVAMTLSYACAPHDLHPAKALCWFMGFQRPSCGNGGQYHDGDWLDFANDLTALIAEASHEPEVLIDLNYRPA